MEKPNEKEIERGIKMALKALMIKRSIEQKKEQLRALEEKDAEFKTREAELEKSIEEAVSDDEQSAVAEEVDKFDAEKKEHETAKTALNGEIEKLEADLETIERSVPKLNQNKKKTIDEGSKKMNLSVNIRALPASQRAFDALPVEARTEMVQRDDVKQFLTELRSMKGQTRSITGGELTIPVVFLDLIAENIYRYSKLVNRVRVRYVDGQARQTIAGTVPEAVWTEMCGAINELTFAFNQVTLDGYKVAGYIPVCNSLLEDNDVNLASWIVEMISESIGYALDKAILYGNGSSSHMPLGIVTRLAQDSAPAGYPSNAPAWQDLSNTNLVTINSNGMTYQQFWAALMGAVANTTTLYSRGRLFWAMNSRTYWKLRSFLIFTNMEGRPVTNVPEVMPFIDGDVDILEFIPDGDIICGYGDLYLLAIRGGLTIEASNQVQFIQDNTVFRGKERADGMPVVPGAFVAININNAAPTTVMNFAADNANDAQLQSITIGTESLNPSFNSSVYSYAIAAAANASDAVLATPAQPDAKIAINYNGKNVVNGEEVSWVADGKAYPLTISVTMGNKTRAYTINVTKAEG